MKLILLLLLLVTTLSVLRLPAQYDPLIEQPLTPGSKLLNLQEVKRMMTWPQHLEAGWGSESRVCGWTDVLMLVDEKGEYMRHVILSSDDGAIADSVAKWLHLLRFAPTMYHDTAIGSWHVFPIYMMNPAGYVEPVAPVPLNLEEVKESIAERMGPCDPNLGKVVAKILVDGDGNPTDIQILKSAHAGLSEIVAQELENLLFTPGSLCGRFCPQWTLIPIQVCDP
jgi:hypothetical protein